MPAHTATDPAYEQFMNFQRMQWEQLKEFQTLHRPQKPADVRPTPSPVPSKPARQVQQPGPMRQMSRPSPNAAIPHPFHISMNPGHPKSQPKAQSHSSSQRMPSWFENLLDVALENLNSPAPSSPSKSPSPQKNQQRSNPSPVAASKPREECPAPSRKSAVKRDMESQPPASPTAAVALELEKVATQVEDVMKKKASGEYNKTQAEGYLMKALLALDQLPVVPLLRPVRKSLVADINRELDRLSAPPAPINPSEAESQPAIESEVVEESSPIAGPQDAEDSEDLDEPSPVLEGEEINLAREEAEDELEAEDFVVLSEDAESQSSSEAVDAASSDAPADESQPEPSSAEEENLTLEITQALLAASEGSLGAEVITPGGPEEEHESDAKDQSSRDQQPSDDQLPGASSEAVQGVDDSKPGVPHVQDIEGVIIEDVSEEEALLEAVLPCA